MNSHADEERVVVSCSACQTKFAVLASSIATMETPRFHCSRCDNVFTVDKSQLETLKINQPATTIEEEEVKPEPEPTVEESIQVEAATIEPEIHIEETQPEIEPEVYSQEEQLEAEPEFIPPTEDPIVEENVLEEDVELVAVEQTNLDEAIEPEPTPLPSDSDLFQETPLEALPPDPEPLLDLDDSPQGYRTPESSPKLEPDNFGPPIDQTLHSFSTYSPWKSCFLVVTPICLCLVLLFVLGLSLRSLPSLANSYVTSLTSKLPQVAPAELYISDLRFKSLSLESGEAITVVSGTLNNDSDHEFKAVELEALGFDNDGNAISNVKIYAGAGLGNAKVKSLSVDMIRDLQDRPPIKRFNLPPKDTYNFSIALTDTINTEQEVAYFSARVYSVVS